MGFYWAFRDLIPETSRLAGLWGMARSTGWFWAFKGAVIFTRRPVELHRDGIALHRDGGPALLYRDGFALWMLHGVRVPRWLAEDRTGAIDPRRILEIDNAEVRREFGRKVGIDRICYSLGAEAVDRCGEYELLMLDLGDGRRRPYLKMQNPSMPGIYHVEGIHPGCRTVQEALNFRNGLRPDQIDDANGVDWLQQGDVLLRPKGAVKFKSRPIILT